MNGEMIKVEHISKKFCKSLKRSMLYGIMDITRNLFGMRTKSGKLRKNEFWALDDVSFELKKGEVLGIIGPNGAGKSTLLKLLNGIFWPDKGKIIVGGRVGALIEVGAGFHPLLSGKENIYLNGAILGMTKNEIRNKFDEIVEFAGIGDFLDTPVKHYSSGMFVRLGFSIAVHSDPDILLVDEILSVGDMNFQAKSKKKIIELLKKDVSIILVSHNLNLISSVCKRTILLSKDSPFQLGVTSKMVDMYKSQVTFGKQKVEQYGSGEITIDSIHLFNEGNVRTDVFKPHEKAIFEIKYSAKEKIKDPVFAMGIFDLEGIQVTGIRTDSDEVETGVFKGEGILRVSFEKLFLQPGSYSVGANIYESRGISFYSRVVNIAQFQILGEKRTYGYISIPHKWEIEKAE